MPPEAPASLLEAQRRFARVVCAADVAAALAAVGAETWAAPPPIALADRLAVYNNNARQFFRGALESTYPVLRRRVGDDYFRQLAHEYRAAHPSRSGDLHWVGEAFPDWLAHRLAGGDYAWLADLARLEWACATAATVRAEPPLDLEALASVPPERLDDTVPGLQPSLRLVASPWPIWSVWQANQAGAEAAPVDLDLGAEHCACACLDDRVAVYRLDADDHALLARLADGATFATALDAAGSTPQRLARLLGWAFGERLVVALSPCARA